MNVMKRIGVIIAGPLFYLLVLWFAAMAASLNGRMLAALPSTSIPVAVFSIIAAAAFFVVPALAWSKRGS